MGKKKGKGKPKEESAPPSVQEQPSGSCQQAPPPQEPPQPKKQEQKQESLPTPQQGGGGKKKIGQKQDGGSQAQQLTKPSQDIPKKQQGHPPQQQGHQQQQQGYPQQQQRHPQEQQGYPQQQQRHPQQQQGYPQQQQGHQQQQQGYPQQQQRHPQQQHPQHQQGHPQQQQGYPQQQQRHPQQQQKHPQHQQGHPQQQQAYPPQQQRYPQQQQAYPQQQQRYPQQQQAYPQQQQAYPQQQQAYPQQQQGHPPQQQGYPPQQQRYPPQQHGYPTQQTGPAVQQQVGQKQAWGTPQQPTVPAVQQQVGQKQAWGTSQQPTVPGGQQKTSQHQKIPQQSFDQGAGDQGRQKQPAKGQKESRPSSSGDHHAGTSSKQPDIPTKQLAALSTTDSLSVLKYKDKVIPGKLGRRIKIETNHLALSLGKIRTAYHYDVEIIPDTPKKYLRHVMAMFIKAELPGRSPAFDGRKNLYSASPLSFEGTKTATVVFLEPDGRKKEYKVEVKFANEVDMTGLIQGTMGETPREALQVVDIVLRNAPSLTLTPVGRSFFHKPAQIIDLGEGMEMYFGFYQSAVRGWKPFLNVDVAHKAFPKNILATHALIDLFASDYRPITENDVVNRPLDNFQLAKFEKFIKGLKISYEVSGGNKRSYKVNGLGGSVSTSKIKLETGRVITIEQYFAERYRTILRFRHTPTLWVGNMARADKMLLPLELCTIEAGQALMRKMTENQTSKMIRQAATSTTVRKEKIMRALNQAKHNTDPSVREFGFSIANEFEKLEARVLNPPDLVYANEKKVSVSRGVWRGERFFRGVEIRRWTIACADRPPRGDEIGNFARLISRHSSECGMQFGEPMRPFENIGNRPGDVKAFFNRIKGQYDVVFIVVPNSGTTYSMVKTAAELNTGCLTQCLKMFTLCRKMNPQTAINILLKVNAKRNGVNQTLLNRPRILDKPCMIMGADVTHPSPDAQNIPSVAAVTASHEPKAFSYNICWRLQPPKVEIIQDLQNIVVEQLLYFYKCNRQMKPQKIVFFRDGVSEGQFEQVINTELRAIRAACKKLEPDGYEPNITFLVVQKRHHTRLFPLNPRDSEDKNVNVPAGTCVDTDITHPHLQDFYLVSHASIQGVAKPTKYCTLWDDNDLSNDELEALTYHLCHMFSRCTRSVSYPAPTYYAHLAAARAKVYIENERLDMRNLDREREKYLIQDAIRKDLPMFFV